MFSKSVSEIKVSSLSPLCVSLEFARGQLWVRLEADHGGHRKETCGFNVVSVGCVLSVLNSYTEYTAIKEKRLP